VLAIPVVPVAAPLTAQAATCTAAGLSGFPSNPNFDIAERTGGLTSTHTWDQEQWYLYGCIPQDAPLDGTLGAQTDGASGMRVYDLWNRATNPERGNDQTVVAYMEGGINWRIQDSCLLRLRSFLNKGELPYPEDGSGNVGTGADKWDLNSDGVFNVDDYRNDPRVRSADTAWLGQAGNHQTPAGTDAADGGFRFLHHTCNAVNATWSDITPEDVILAFGHCQLDNTAHTVVQCPPGGRFDNDGNGYPGDISGWNFNRDDNDPQTEQSIYHHFTGESAQLVGEANPTLGGAGMCPQCRYVPIKAGDEAIDRPDRVAEALVYAADNGVDVFDGTDASLGENQEVKAAMDYAYHKGMVLVWASNDFESADHTDGMYYPHVWPGNGLSGDHSTRNGATCNVPPTSTTDAFCTFVRTNTTFLSRSSLTSYGPHALFVVPTNDGSTSTSIPTQAGVAALVVAEGKDAARRGQISAPLSPDEVKQVVRWTATPISAPCPAVEPCFASPSASTGFNIQYGYGRPNLLAAANAVDAGKIPPTVDIRSPDWYQEVDPLKQSTLQVKADVQARRATLGAYTWQLQYGLGPQPADSGWTTFASGVGLGPQTVGGSIDLTQSALQQFATAEPYTVDPSTRLSIEQYDVSVRVRVFASGDTTNPWNMGEDRRAFHLRHDATEAPGFPVAVGASGEASPTMADIEGRGWLDTIIPTSDGTVHAYRPDGSEAPGFPVHTGVAIGMDPTYSRNYLNVPTWKNNLVPRPRDGTLSAAAVGDLFHNGSLDIVIGTLNGNTWAWDGAGHVLPGFPKFDGTMAAYNMSVPPPDTPYSFEPENLAGTSPVLADLEGNQQLDIVQAAGDNHVYAWRPDGTAVPGWPVCTIFMPVPASMAACVEPPQTGSIVHTHDGKIVPTPAVAKINGHTAVIVGLDDTTWDNAGLGSTKITAYLEAFDARGTLATPTGMLANYPVAIPGLEQGYGVAQDFVTQGTESPAVYDTSNGPMAVINANLFLPVSVNLDGASAGSTPFGPTTVPAGGPGDCATPLTPTGPVFAGTCTLVQFTTSASLGTVVPGTGAPQAFQGGSSATDVVLGITQAPGFGVRVENGVGGWDPSTGAPLPQFSHYLQGLAFFSAPAIADVTGDGTPDVIQPADSGAVEGFDGASGQVAGAFPKWTGEWSLFTPAVGDVFGNGKNEVAVATREGYLHMFETSGVCAGNAEAWHWHQDDRNTGHYGTDTRPPSAIADLTVTQQGANDVLTFTAVGNDWKCGTADHYLIRRSSQPILQSNWDSATDVTVSVKPKASGQAESITVPHVDGQSYYAVRAVDTVGNIGPIRVVSDVSLPNFGQTATPNTAAAAPALLPLGLVLAGLGAGVLARRRRRRAGLPD